jgi:transcriptional regulator with XRE-family HTH domain
MEKDFGYILGSNIRAERLRRHYTQENLAELLDMSINYIGKLERGVVIPSSYVLFRLSKLLHVDINDFFKDIDLDNEV